MIFDSEVFTLAIILVLVLAIVGFFSENTVMGKQLNAIKDTFFSLFGQGTIYCPFINPYAMQVMSGSEITFTDINQSVEANSTFDVLYEVFYGKECQDCWSGDQPPGILIKSYEIGSKESKELCFCAVAWKGGEEPEELPVLEESVLGTINSCSELLSISDLNTLCSIAGGEYQKETTLGTAFCRVNGKNYFYSHAGGKDDRPELCEKVIGGKWISGEGCRIFSFPANTGCLPADEFNEKLAAAAAKTSGGDRAVLQLLSMKIPAWQCFIIYGLLPFLIIFYLLNDILAYTLLSEKTKRAIALFGSLIAILSGGFAKLTQSVASFANLSIGGSFFLLMFLIAAFTTVIGQIGVSATVTKELAEAAVEAATAKYAERILARNLMRRK